MPTVQPKNDTEVRQLRDRIAVLEQQLKENSTAQQGANSSQCRITTDRQTVVFASVCVITLFIIASVV